MFVYTMGYKYLILNVITDKAFQMSKSIKYIVIGLVLLILIAAVGIGIFVATFNPNSYKPQIQNLVKKQTNRQLQINGDINLKVFPNIALVINDVALLEPNDTENFVSIKQTSMGVALMPLLSKKVIADSINIDGLTANVIVDKDGGLNFDDLLNKSSQPDTNAKPTDNQVADNAGSGDKSQNMEIDIAGISISNSKVNYINHLSNQNYSISNIDLKTGQIDLYKPISIKLTGNIESSPALIKSDFDIDTAVLINDDVYALQKLLLTLNGKLADLSLKQTKINADITFNQANKLLAVNNLAVGVSADMSGDTSISDMALNTKADSILVDLNDNINTNDFIALLLSNKPLSIKNLQGNFKSKNIIASDINLQNPSLNFAINDGSLIADNIKANLYDGTITGRYSINAKKNMTVNANVSDINVGDLAKDYLKEERMTGKGNIAANLNMQGLDADSILSSLNGSVQANIEDGKWQGIDLEQTIEDVRVAIKNIRNRQLPSVSSKDDESKHTSFEQLQAQAKINRGIVDIDSLVVATKRLEITQGDTAQINLPASNVDMIINIQKRLADGSIPPESKDVNLDKLEGVVVPVHVSGDFDALSYRVKTSDLAKTILKGALQGDLVDGIKDILGGKSSNKDADTDSKTKSNKVDKDSIKDIGKSIKGLFK